MSKTSNGNPQSQGGGFDFRTLVSLAALIAAGAAIYYAYTVDPAKQVADLEGSIKSLNAKISDLPETDDVKRLIQDNVKIPPAGPSAEDVQTLIDKGTLTSQDIQKLIDQSRLTTQDMQALIDQSRMTTQDVQVLIDKSRLSETDVQAIVKQPLDDIRSELAALPSEDRVRAIAGKVAETSDEKLITNEVPNLISANAVPQGAVVAFATPCPAERGWKEYEQARGRFLVAAGEHTDAGGTSRTFTLGTGTNDGAYKHALTKDELAAHRHGVERQGPTRGIEGLPPLGTDGAIIAVIEQEMTLVAGKGTAHNNVPPYIALYFCEKT